MCGAQIPESCGWEAKREGNRFLCYLLQETPEQKMPAGLRGNPGRRDQLSTLHCSGRDQIDGNRGFAVHFSWFCWRIDLAWGSHTGSVTPAEFKQQGMLLFLSVLIWKQKLNHFDFRIVRPSFSFRPFLPGKSDAVYPVNILIKHILTFRN